MIYPGIRVPLPDMGGYIFKRGNVNYLYVYVGERQSTETEGKTTHPKSKCIGRVEINSENKQELMPNTYYYELMGLSQPDVAVMEGAGRKPWKEKPKPAEKREISAEIAVGYGLAVMLLSAELQLTQILKDTFGETLGKRILSLAAFMCERAHSSLDGLDQFIGNHLAGTNLDMTFDRRAAGQVLVDITPEQCGNFYTQWNKAHPAGREIFYDVTSFSTYSGQIISAHYGYNRDHDDLPQINQGLFCDRDTGLPLFMCSYDGSLNDKANFNYALKRAREHGIGVGKGKKRVSIVTDGGFSRENVDWSHFLGYDIIIGVSCDCLKAVKEAYTEWTLALKESDRAGSWMQDDNCYIATTIPFKLGNVDGELMMYRDLTFDVDKRKQLSRIREKKKSELENIEKAPKENFSQWAKSFSPYYKISRCAGRKGFSYEEDSEAFAQACALCGKVTLFVKRNYHKLNEQEILRVYRSKESVEDCFDTTKNGLSDKRLHVHGDRQINGKLFVMFVSLILRRTFHRRIADYLKEKGMTDETAIRELEQIKFYKGKDGWSLKDAISKTQREILTELNLKLREDAEVHESLFRQRVRKGRKSKLTEAKVGTPVEEVLEGTL
jgi:hypothetical protein